jgi:hypothetical protein
MGPCWVKNILLEKSESGFSKVSINGYFACLTLQSQIEATTRRGANEQ